MDRYRTISLEADAYFRRNGTEKERVTQGARTAVLKLRAILQRLKHPMVLEIGCSYGYNLNYIKREIPNAICFGIDPSEEAVKYGECIYDSIHLKQGFSHELPFEDNSFDVVMLGFCLYTLDRRDYYRTIAEVDRVLKTGGFVAIWDFDTINNFSRVNKHNIEIPVYKMNIYNTFGGNPQYYLVEKQSFSHEGDVFHPDVQERCSLYVFYKEDVKNAYLLTD